MCTETISEVSAMIRRLGVACACVLWALTFGSDPGRSGDSQPKTSHIHNNEEEGLPIARPDRPLPSHRGKRALRLKRNRAFNSSGAPITTSTGDVLVFGELQPERMPIAKSDVIVVGRVISGEAFVSENEAAVYSEFQVRAEDVLRARAHSGIRAGGLVTAIRWGGMLQLPSGRVIRVEMANERLPHLGGRYLLFLRHDRDLEAYRILTAYGLEGNQAQTLEGARGAFPDTGRPARPGPERADALLAEVRRLVSSSNGRVQ